MNFHNEIVHKLVWLTYSIIACTCLMYAGVVIESSPWFWIPVLIGNGMVQCLLPKHEPEDEPES